MNVTGTLNMLEMCKRYGTQKMVFTSSIAVYGQGSQTPLDEEVPKKPISSYGVSKSSAEDYLSLYRDEVRNTVLRLSNVYGPKDSFGNDVITRFIRGGIHDGFVTIYGDGKQTRDFVYVEDVCDAIISSVKDHKSDLFNVGGPTEVSLLDLHRYIQKKLDKQIVIKWKNSRRGDIKRISVSNRKIRERLGWKPVKKLSEGLDSIINYEKFKYQ